MLNEIETQSVAISSEAAQAVQDIMTERKLEGYALRVFVSGGGCCGAQFGMALDNNITDMDSVIETHNIKLVVDRTSLEYLNGAKIEYVDDPVRGKGFAVNNPNQHSNCSGEGSSCDGTCSCNN
jgi:iron-sulfur cluster assembly accessory protein